MRNLMRDYWIHEVSWSSLPYADIFHGEYPVEIVEDIAIGFMRLKHRSNNNIIHLKPVDERKDKCHYHRHDEHHPRCTPKPEAKSKKANKS